MFEVCGFGFTAPVGIVLQPISKRFFGFMGFRALQ